MLGLGWAGFGLGLKLVSATRLLGGLLAAGQPDQAAGCAWNLGWAGWAELRLGGLLDGQGLCQTHLGVGGKLAGLGLRPVADT